MDAVKFVEERSFVRGIFLLPTETMTASVRTREKGA